MLRSLSVILMLGLALSLPAQDVQDIYGLAAEILENTAEMLDEEGDYSALIDQIADLIRNPININSATREDLNRIFFLSDMQIEALLFQRYQNKAFYSIYELQAVEGLDRRTLEYMEPLISFGIESQAVETPLKVKGDLFLRSQFQIQKRQGYKEREDGTTYYLGDRFRHYGRYEMQVGKQWQMGLIAEKDPGEPMFTDEIKTFDFVSGYLSWKGNKVLKQVIAGQYRMSAGQGLALQTGMAPVKSSDAVSIRNRQQVFGPSLSATESEGLYGLILDLGTERLSVIPFVSLRKRDARLDTLSNGDIVIRSLKTDGYHRTLTELSQRRNADETAAGLRTRLYAGRFIVDGGFMHYMLEYPIEPEQETYRLIYFKGSSNQNYWLSTEGSIGKVFLFSELAFDKTGDPAIWAGLQHSPKGILDVVLAYRRIDMGYRAPLGAPLTEASQPAGESGFYTGISIPLPAALTLDTYIDYYRHKWPKYQIDAPHEGFDWLVVLCHKPSKEWENSIRLRYRDKPVNINTGEPAPAVATRSQTQLRFQSSYMPSKIWTFSFRADVQSVSHAGEGKLPKGYFFAQDVKFAAPNKNLTINARYALFDAEEYDTRIFAYEPDVLYSFSTPAYYGKGSRFILMAKWTPLPRLDLWLRYAAWKYSDREEIGTGQNRISGDLSSELKFQIRKRF